MRRTSRRSASSGVRADAVDPRPGRRALSPAGDVPRLRASDAAQPIRYDRCMPDTIEVLSRSRAAAGTSTSRTTSAACSASTARCTPPSTTRRTTATSRTRTPTTATISTRCHRRRADACAELLRDRAADRRAADARRQGRSTTRSSACRSPTPASRTSREFSDIASHWQLEIDQFFRTYKKLQELDVDIYGWGDRAEAWRIIEAARAAFAGDAKLVIATNNRGKLREFQQLLDGCGFELVTPRDLGTRFRPRRDGVARSRRMLR